MASSFIKFLPVLFISIGIHLAAIGQSTGTITYKELGLKFTIPNGWVGQESEGGFIMGHETTPGMIMILLHDQQYSMDQMRQEAQAGIQMGEGSYLGAIGTLSQIDNSSIGGEFAGTIDYHQAKAYIIGKVNPHGFGITIMALTTEELYNNLYQSLAQEVSNNTQFSKATLAPGNDAGSWKEALGNTKLTYMDSYYSGGGDYGGGYSSKTVIDICTAGYFNYYENSSVSVSGDHSGAYSHGSADGNGKWNIQEKSGASYLLLQFYDGTSQEFKLEWGENKKLLLNGTRYFRTWTGDEAPSCN